MASKSSGSDLVAQRYASALLDMAADAKIIEKVEKDMADLCAMLEGSPDLQKMIANPLINRGQQQKAILALAEKGKLQKLTASFLGVLAQNRRIGHLPAVVKAFARELSRRRGEVAAHVETAFALSAAQTKALQEQLSRAMGSHVTLNVVVNKDLLGGMTVTVGSVMIDDSVRRKLERLGRSMGAGSNDSKHLKEVG